MKVNHVIVANFYVANMYLNAIRENKILANFSEFTIRITLNTSVGGEIPYSDKQTSINAM